MKQLCFLLCFFFIYQLKGQELYVFTEPASNLPAKSISAKLSGMFMSPQPWHNQSMQRIMPEVRFGISKKWMLDVGVTFANMHTDNFTWEAIYVYGKYRFLSNDDVHAHFRMAAFAEASYTRAPFHNDEVNLGGDKNGLKAGIIATQLWNKFALSAAVSHVQILDKSRNSKTIIYVPSRVYQGMSYSLSGGYLLLPAEYKDYKQTNLNLYAEFLAQQSLDRKAYFIDMAPAIQLIFNSNTKLNFGYRFQLGGTMQRMAKESWQVSLERTFLNALKKKKTKQ
ncbi:MAG TPA: hypothetical protein VI461_11230 [Chitinophagaceae bacterium]|nr:hypothetical protein [Chitinophagaceae bacterium]